MVINTIFTISSHDFYSTIGGFSYCYFKMVLACNIIFQLLIFTQLIKCYYSGVVINEINTETPDKPEKQEFIELIAFGTSAGSFTQLKDFNLRGYKIIVISAYNKAIKASSIELVANLWNSQIKNSCCFRRN